MTLIDILTGIKNWILSKFIPGQVGYITTTEKGLISQTFIDLVTTAGAAFNSETGYFELNGINDIPLDEMREIYNDRNQSGNMKLGAVMAKGNGPIKTYRTNFPLYPRYFGYANFGGTTVLLQYALANSPLIEVFAIGDSDKSVIYMDGACANNFGNNRNISGYDSRLRRIIGIINVSNITSNDFMYSPLNLEQIYLKGIKRSYKLASSSKLSNESILYMIANSAATSAITITLHADAYARAIADEDISAALEAHPLVTLASA